MLLRSLYKFHGFITFIDYIVSNIEGARRLVNFIKQLSANCAKVIIHSVQDLTCLKDLNISFKGCDIS